MVETVHSIVLAGGSAYGLAAANGVMNFLEEKGFGFNVGVGIVPIVPAAVIFDLDVGIASIRPDAIMGYLAAENATSNPVKNGSVGAGTGAKVGAMSGKRFACKSGIGSAAIKLSDGVIVAALMVVNALGDVYDAHGNILAGTRTPPDGDTFGNTLDMMQQRPIQALAGSNTIIGVVATNATLSKAGINKVAQMAHNGIAQRIKPAHTMYDGDTIFGLATGTAPDGDISVIGAFAAEATAQAIENAIHAATPLDGLPTGSMINNA